MYVHIILNIVYICVFHVYIYIYVYITYIYICKPHLSNPPFLGLFRDLGWGDAILNPRHDGDELLTHQRSKVPAAACCVFCNAAHVDLDQL